MLETVQVLDHGYISLVEYWGSDERIVEAARMSTQKGFLGWGDGTKECILCKHRETKTHQELRLFGEQGKCPVCGNEQKEVPGDERLLAYLWHNRHFTPFEQAGFTVEVQAPIFVFREWHRHRTQSYNEMSSRYTPLPALDYVPTTERLLMNNTSVKNKQAGCVADSAVLDEVSARDFRRGLKLNYDYCQEFYEHSLKNGVPKELARLCLPVARYSKMRASSNLRNWTQFLTLRCDVNAQWEIRQYADVICDTFMKALFPRVHRLFKETF